jgi:putative endonuclease
MALQMQFDFEAARPLPGQSDDTPARTRAARSATGYRAGLSAEDQVARDYEDRGYPVLARRWRGGGGEIDLALQDGDGVVFVEVKKSGSFDRALARVTPKQVSRLFRAAEAFLAEMPNGALTTVRFDLGLVNAHGQLRIVEKALTG